jgi:hypothetical protein
LICSHEACGIHLQQPAGLHCPKMCSSMCSDYSMHVILFNKYDDCMPFAEPLNFIIILAAACYGRMQPCMHARQARRAAISLLSIRQNAYFYIIPRSTHYMRYTQSLVRPSHVPGLRSQTFMQNEHIYLPSPVPCVIPHALWFKKVAPPEQSVARCAVFSAKEILSQRDDRNLGKHVSYAP